MSSLNPLHDGRSADRRGNRGRTRASAGARRASAAIQLLGDVGLPQPERRIDDYPHQFSGGMRQRVMIAMAICTNPDVLDRRRADDRARRDDAGADHGSARPARRGAADGRDPDHARPRPRLDLLRRHPRHVRGPDRRERHRAPLCSARPRTRTRRRCSTRSAASTGTSSGRSPRSRGSRRYRTSCPPAVRSTRAAPMRRRSARAEPPPPVAVRGRRWRSVTSRCEAAAA